MKRTLNIRPFVGADGQWYFRIVGKNGEPVAISEGYSTRANARRSATMLRDNLHEAKMEEGND